MVEINLIPAILRKDGKGNANSLTVNIPREILVGVGSGMIFLMVVAHLFLGTVWWAGMKRLSREKADWQKILPDKTALDAIHKESGDLKKKIGMVSGMTTEKSILWSPKFNAISDALPSGLWIRRMILDKSSLTMEGSVVSKNQNEINNVGVFLSTLKLNDYFMKDFFSLEVNSIQRGRNNAVEVTDFTVMAKLK